MTPKRVLLTADAVGGVFTYALTLATQLSARGVSIDLAVLGPPARDEQRAAARTIPRLTLHELDCALEWMDDPWRDVTRSSAWLSELAQRVRPDLVHANGFAIAAAPFRVPVVLGAHSSVLSWWDAVMKDEPVPTRYDAYGMMVRRGIAAADAVITPSRAMLSALAKRHDVAHGHVVHNGAPIADHVEAKESFVLTCGRLWDRAKNVAAITRIAPRLPWPVKLAGCGAEDAELEHLGWLSPPELHDVMARAAIVALPSLYEPFGLCALEAALRACALVLGDLDSQREIWGDAAIYVDGRDDEAIARTIDTLARDTSLRTRMGERAFHRALTYTPAKMADATLAVYAAAMREGTRDEARCA